MSPNEQPPLQHPNQPLNEVPPSAPEPTGPTPQQQMEAELAAANQPAPSAKKTYHPKRFMIALGVFVGVCLLAVAAMVLVTLLPMQQSKKAEAPSTSTDTQVDKTISAKQAIAHIKEYFKVEGTAKNGITLPVRATGKDFYTVIPDAAATTSVAGDVAPDKIAAQLASVVHSLEGDGFTKRVQNDGTTGKYLADFSRKETFCEVVVTKPADTKAAQWLEARCADMATYDEYAKAQEPLVRLYTPLSATSVLYGFVGKPAPVVSKTTGYNTAELQVSIVIDNTMTSTGKYALYYQTPDGLWHYWRDRDASAVFACDQYDTNELKNAYLGTACRDTGKNTDSTVPAPRKQ